MSAARTTTRRSYRQACPVAHALDVVGERWTLLIVRDLVFGPLRFTDLRDGLPGLAPNLLADRLQFLVERGLVQQVELPPPAARTVYELTARGRELGPVVHELSRFGVADWDDPDEAPPPPRLVRGALLALLAPETLDRSGWSARVVLMGAAEDPATAATATDNRGQGPEEGTPEDVVLEVLVAPARTGVRALERLRVRVADSAPADQAAGLGPGTPSPVIPGDRDAGPADVDVCASLGTLLALRRHELTRVEAEEAGRLAVTGTATAVDRWARLAGWT